MTNEEILAKLRTLWEKSENGNKEFFGATGKALKAALEQAAELQSEVSRLYERVTHLEGELSSGPLPEAAGSINLRMVDPETGATPQFTFRYHSDAKAVAAWPQIKRDLASLKLIGEEEYQERRRAERAAPPAAPTGQPPKANGGPGLPPVASHSAESPPARTQAKEELSFEAKSLEGERKKGKNYWKVKGGKYVRHGVTIWEEVLTAAGFDFESLNPDEVYNLSGYTAHYEMDEEGKNPKKVTRLERN